MAFVTCTIAIIFILCVNQLEVDAYKRSVLDLPDLSILSTSDPGVTKYQVSGCEISLSQDGCKIAFAPVEKSCKSGLSLSQIVKRFFPNLDIKKLSSGMVTPSIFKIEKFSLNKCEGEIDFTATANEPFEVIPDRLTISQGKLTIGFNFKASGFDMTSFSILIDGILTVGAQTLKMSVNKTKKSDEFHFSAEGERISLSAFAKLFTKKDLAKKMGASGTKKIESLISAYIDKPKIIGLRDKDGMFEFVVKGSIRDLSVMDKAELFLIIQKPVDGRTAVAVVLQFKGISPTEIVSLMTGKDLSKLPLVKDVALNFVLELATNTIESVRDVSMNKVLVKYISNGRTVCKGVKIKVELPIHEIVRSVNKHMVGKVPESIFVSIFFSSSTVEFVFPDDFKTNLLNILIALTPAIPKFLPKSVFKNGPPKVDINRFTVDVKTGTVDLSVVAPDPIVIGNDLVTISNATLELKHDKTPDSPWEFKVSAEQQIPGGPSLNILVEKRGKSNYLFSADVKSLTTEALVKKFGATLFPTKSLEELKFFNFGIRNLNMQGAIDKKISLRISGNPVLFDWEGAKLEGFMFGDAKKSMALGISLASIRMDEIIMKLFNKKLKNTWLTEVNVGLTLSNVDAGKDKNIAFTLPELKNMAIKKGAMFSTVLTLPRNCKGDALCNQAKAMLDKDTRFILEGEVRSTGMELKASYKGNMKIHGTLELSDVKFVISVGKETTVYFEVVMKMTEPKIVFKGKLGIGATGEVELKLTMDNMWEKPFGLEYLAFGNLILSVGIQPGAPVPILEIGGEVHFGKINSGKEIKAQAYLGLNPTNPLKNYFYTNINKLSAETIARAFEYDLKLPRVLAESGFPEGVIASFTTNPAGKTFDHLGTKINPGFSLKGLINILGFKLRCNILINFRKEIMLEVAFSPIKIANGLIALQRTKQDEENGPKLYAKLTVNSVHVKLQAFATLLGISASVDIHIADDYMKFHTYGNLFNLFAANLTVQAGYKKLEEADFLVASCISTPIGNIQDKVGSSLEDAADKASKAVKEGEKKVENSTSLYDKARSKLVKWEDRVKEHENEIREACDKVQKMKDELDDPCLDKCGEVCIGGAYWKKKCTKILGKWLGCSKWNKCKHKVPDTICIAKCKGKKVIKKVTGVAKQAGIEVMLGILSKLKKVMRFAQKFVEKSRTLIDLAEKGLNAIRQAVEVGTEIGRAIANYTVNGLVNIHHLCFNTSLEKASSSCFGINVNATFFGRKRVEFQADTCMDVSFIQSMAKVIKNKLFPGVQFIKKGLEKAKSVFFDMEGQRDELEKDIEKEEAEDIESVAFGDLPRVTLLDDDTVKAFEEHSPWKMIQSDQLFEEDLSEDDYDMGSSSGSGEKENLILQTRDFSSTLKERDGCHLVRSALAELRPLVTALHSFHENLHNQRRSYIEEKKSKLQELQSVQEELLSECNDADMTEQEKKNAMFYLGKAKNGTWLWLDALKKQIKEQEKQGLMLWKKDIEVIMRHKRGTGVGPLLSDISQKQSEMSKRNLIESRLKSKLKRISELTQKLLFDEHSSFEKQKPLLMNSLRKEFDEAEALLASSCP
eukprot:gene16608-18294_t